MRVAVASAVLLAALLSAREARAEERPFLFSLALEGESPLEACGGAPALEEAITTRLHREVFTNRAAADVVLQVSFDATGRARLVERDRAGIELGQRDVTMPKGDCAKSLETLAVVLAITIGPPKTVTVPPPAPPPEPPAPAIAAPPPPAPLPPRPPPSPSPLVLLDDGPPPWRVSPVLEGAMGTGVLPHVSFGVQGGAALQTSLRRLAVLARAAYWPARATDTAAEAEVDRAGAAIAGCWAFLRRVPTSIAACGGFELARLHSTSLALTRSSENGVFLDTFVEGRLGYRLVSSGNLVIEPVIAAQIAAVLRRDRFTYRDREGQERTLLQPAAAAIQTSIGVAVHFL